jgi:parallel beta helix pectate lyase-like protein
VALITDHHARITSLGVHELWVVVQFQMSFGPMMMMMNVSSRLLWHTASTFFISGLLLGVSLDAYGAATPRGQNCSAYIKVSATAGKHEYIVDGTVGNDANDGSAAHPFKTVQKAAAIAQAGDVVTIRPGTYSGRILVRNSGATGSPILFQAEQCGLAVFTDNTGFFPGALNRFNGGTCLPNFPVQHDITLSGLTFQNTNNGPIGQYSTVIFPTTNWLITNVLIDGATDTEVNARGTGIVIDQSTFTHARLQSLVGCGGATVVKNVLNMNNVTDAKAAASCGNSCSVKFLFTNGMLVDNIESFGNNGPGWWFDSQNQNFTIQNSYFHNNNDAGVFDEISDGPGLIQNNTFDHNKVDLLVAESQFVTVQNNLFNGGSGIPWQFRTMTNRCKVTDRTTGACLQYWWLKNLTFQYNKVKNWTQVLVHDPAYSSNPQWASPLFQTLNIQMDYDQFWPLSSNSTWLFWQGEPTLKSFSAFQNTLNVEAHGTQAPF